jgi:uncharacterized protein YcfJ
MVTAPSGHVTREELGGDALDDRRGKGREHRHLAQQGEFAGGHQGNRVDLCQTPSDEQAESEQQCAAEPHRRKKSFVGQFG